MQSIPSTFIIVEVVALATLAIAFISVFLLIRRNRRKPPKQDEPREK